MNPCVRPHMRVVTVKLLHKGSSWVWALRRGSMASKAELSSIAGLSLPTSHMAGPCPHHCPTSGTGELQEGGITLLDGAGAPGRTTATPGITPWVANRHRAMSRFRAKATTITLRIRAPVPLAGSRNQVTSAEPGLATRQIAARIGTVIYPACRRQSRWR